MKDTIKLAVIGAIMWALFGTGLSIALICLLVFFLFVFGGKDDK